MALLFRLTVVLLFLLLPLSFPGREGGAQLVSGAVQDDDFAEFEDDDSEFDFEVNDLDDDDGDYDECELVLIQCDSV